MSHELGIERGSVAREGSTSYEREREIERGGITCSNVRVRRGGMSCLAYITILGYS